MLALMMLAGFVALVALPSVLWLYAMADVVRNEFPSLSTKIVWMIVLCLFPPLGTLLYFLVGRSQRTTRYPVGGLVLACILIIPFLMVAAYLLYALGQLTFVPEPPHSIQI